eukprot:1339428-Pleurochrysis_carterae.AAC.3
MAPNSGAFRIACNAFKHCLSSSRCASAKGWRVIRTALLYLRLEPQPPRKSSLSIWLNARKGVPIKKATGRKATVKPTTVTRGVINSFFNSIKCQ